MHFDLNGRQLKINRGMEFRNESVFETEPLDLFSSSGTAYLSMELEIGDDVRQSVVIESGWRSPLRKGLGDPIDVDGAAVGYRLSSEIVDGGDGTLTAGALACSLSHISEEHRHPLVGYPRIESPELEHRLLATWQPVLDLLLHESPTALREFRNVCLLERAVEMNESLMFSWALLRDGLAERDALLQAIRDPKSSPLPEADDGPSFPNPEFRPFPGEPGRKDLDEVVIDGVAFLHAETLSDDAVWIGATLVDGRRVSLNVAGKDVRLFAEIDDVPLTML